MKRRLTIMALWAFANFAAADPIDVSLVNLIATPKDFDGKLVRVLGFVRMEFEGTAIYLHRDDYLHRISKNGLWLDLDIPLNKLVKRADKHYALIEGVFSMNDQGHFGMWSGSINQVTRIEPWPARQ